jgi:hypothetical protein
LARMSEAARGRSSEAAAYASVGAKEAA